MMHASTTQPTAPDDRATEFKAVDGAGEQYSGSTLMVEAYAAIWLIMMVWLAMIWRKQASLTARVQGLEGAITRAERKLGATAAPAAADDETAKAAKDEKTEKETTA